MPIHLDASNAPYLHTRAEGHITGEHVKGYLAQMGALLEEGKRFVMMFNTVDIGATDRAAVTLHAAFFKQRHDECARLWRGLALVINSPAPRFLLTSLLLVVRLPMPYEVVDSVDKGRRYAQRRLREEGLPVPAVLEAYR